jgi:hypothetical protein
VRGNSLLTLVIDGRMVCKKPRGRPRIGMGDKLKEGSYVKVKRRAEDSDNRRTWMPNEYRNEEN